MRKSLKILRRGFYRTQKTKMGTFEGVFVVGVQLKLHNFGQCE